LTLPQKQKIYKRYFLEKENMQKWIYRIMLILSVIYAAIGLNIPAIIVGFSAMLGYLFYYLRKPSTI